MIKRALIFVTSMAVVAGIAWVGGYAFDSRSPEVAFYALLAVCLSAWVAVGFPFDD